MGRRAAYEWYSEPIPILCSFTKTTEGPRMGPKLDGGRGWRWRSGKEEVTEAAEKEGNSELPGSLYLVNKLLVRLQLAGYKKAGALFVLHFSGDESCRRRHLEAAHR